MRRALTIGLALTALAAPAPAAALEEGALAPDGAWSWFSDPRAVYHDGDRRATYTGWVTKFGDIAVAAYDHDTRTTASSVLAPGFQIDDHDNPSIYVREDGRITAFWTAHDGDDLFFRVSANPEDVTAWGPTRTAAPTATGSKGHTYPNPMRLAAEDRLWLFWRGSNWQPNFSVSADDGETWSAPAHWVEVAGHRPYAKYHADGEDTIHMAFNEGNPGSFLENSLYYAAYRDGKLWKADGTEIADMATELPIAPAAADRVYDATGTPPSAWVHDVAADATGHPVIVYATFPSNGDHRYRYARWTGTAWEDRELTPAGPSFPDVGNGKYSAGITLDHEDPSVVWLSRQVSGQFEIERRQTPDGGATWPQPETITSGSSLKNVRPISPRGLPAGADTEAIWMRGSYSGYTSYDTSLMSLFADAPAPADPQQLPGGPAPAGPSPPDPDEDPGTGARSGTPRAAATLRLAVSASERAGRLRARVRGRLLARAGRRPLSRRRVAVYAKRRGSRRWRRAGSALTRRDGRLTLVRRFRGQTWLRLRYGGSSGYMPVASRTRLAR